MDLDWLVFDQLGQLLLGERLVEVLAQFLVLLGEAVDFLVLALLVLLQLCDEAFEFVGALPGAALIWSMKRAVSAPVAVPLTCLRSYSSSASYSCLSTSCSFFMSATVSRSPSAEPSPEPRPPSRSSSSCCSSARFSAFSSSFFFKSSSRSSWILTG